MQRLGLLFLAALAACKKDSDDDSPPPGIPFVSATGVLDTTFNGTGIVVSGGVAGGSTGGYAVRIDGSGRIVVAGFRYNGSNLDMAIWRFDSTGAPDLTFNGTGLVTHDSAAGGLNSDDIGYGLALDGAGRIVVAGSSWNGTSVDMAVWRYLSDGTLDTSFNGVGYVTNHDAGGGADADEGMAVAIDGPGRIVVAGYSVGFALDYDLAVWRYDAAGYLDTSFNGTGFVTFGDLAGGGWDDVANAVLVDGSGRILVGGYSTSPSNQDMLLLRLLADGSPDPSFNLTGIALHNDAAGGSGDDYAKSLALDGSGRIVVAGSSAGTQADMAIWRYRDNGTLDTSFNGVGYVTHNSAAGGNNNDFGYSAAVYGSTQIVVAGASYNGTDYDLVVWRYNGDGTADTSFNGTGFVLHDNAAGGSGHDFGHSLAVAPSGPIVVSGASATASNFDLALWRYR